MVSDYFAFADVYMDLNLAVKRQLIIWQTASRCIFLVYIICIIIIYFFVRREFTQVVILYYTENLIEFSIQFIIIIIFLVFCLSTIKFFICNVANLQPLYNCICTATVNRTCATNTRLI